MIRYKISYCRVFIYDNLEGRYGTKSIFNQSLQVVFAQIQIEFVKCFKIFFLRLPISKAKMSYHKNLENDFFSQPNWPENLQFNSPKTQLHQLPQLNQPNHQAIEILSSSLEIVDTFQNTDDQQFETQNLYKTGKSIKSVKIKKTQQKSEAVKLQAQKQRKLFQKNKSLKKMKDIVETTNTRVMYNQGKHSTSDLLTGEQKRRFDQVVCVKTFQEVKEELKINKKNAKKNDPEIKLQKLKPGKKPLDEIMEQKVIDYVKMLTKANVKFTTSHIRDMAKKFSTNQNFKASKGWYERFQVRNAHIFNNQHKDKKSKE